MRPAAEELAAWRRPRARRPPVTLPGLGVEWALGNLAGAARRARRPVARLQGRPHRRDRLRPRLRRPGDEPRDGGRRPSWPARRPTRPWPRSSTRSTSSSPPPTPTSPIRPRSRSTPGSATCGSGPENNGALTIPANIVGNPAISIPVGPSTACPVGIQVHRPPPRGRPAARPRPSPSASGEPVPLAAVRARGTPGVDRCDRQLGALVRRTDPGSIGDEAGARVGDRGLSTGRRFLALTCVLPLARFTVTPPGRCLPWHDSSSSSSRPPEWRLDEQPATGRKGVAAARAALAAARPTAPPTRRPAQARGVMSRIDTATREAGARVSPPPAPPSRRPGAPPLPTTSPTPDRSALPPRPDGVTATSRFWPHA